MSETCQWTELVGDDKECVAETVVEGCLVVSAGEEVVTIGVKKLVTMAASGGEEGGFEDGESELALEESGEGLIV